MTVIMASAGVGRLCYLFWGRFRQRSRSGSCAISTSSPRANSATTSSPSNTFPRGRTNSICATRSRPVAPQSWRHLRADEIETLVKNNNTCHDWDEFLVTDPFDPKLIKNCEFWGLVRIGRAGERDSGAPRTENPRGHFQQPDHLLRHRRQRRDPQRPLPGPLPRRRPRRCSSTSTRSTRTNHAKFGNGILKDGEPEECAGCDRPDERDGGPPRAALRRHDPRPTPICGPSIATIARLMERLAEITQNQFDHRARLLRHDRRAVR